MGENPALFIMSYKIYHKLISEFKVNLENYALCKDSISDDYHISNVFISDLGIKAYKNIKVLEIALKWLKSKDTIKLIEAISLVGYNANNLKHFNAMSFMDSVNN